jgi:hypothetical protein
MISAKHFLCSVSKPPLAVLSSLSLPFFFFTNLTIVHYCWRWVGWDIGTKVQEKSGQQTWGSFSHLVSLSTFFCFSVHSLVSCLSSDCLLLHLKAVWGKIVVIAGAWKRFSILRCHFTEGHESASKGADAAALVL